MIISNTAIKNRTTVAVLMVLIVFAGVYNYISLPRESFPDVQIPMILVTTNYEGVSPQDIETSITMKLEEKLSGIKGLKEMISSSAEGVSQITLEFDPDIVIEDALQYVRDRVDLAKPELPNVKECDEPVISEINLAEFPIVMINISGKISPVRLKGIADRLEDELEKIPGVLECDVLGALEREIRLEIDPDRLAAYQLTTAEIMRVIPSENVNISAGGLETPGVKFNIRIPAEFTDPGEVNHLPLTTRDGRTIYLADIMKIRDTFKDRTTYARLNGRETITVAVKKRIGVNIIPIADRIKIVLNEFRKRCPKAVDFETTLDQSNDIRSMIKDLENNILSGLILVVIVLVLFMGWRTSTIVAMAIPLSMLISFVIIQLLGYTLNMMVLFALIMALGMLVDNAIVIVENIYRHAQMGYNRIEAAMKGTSEVAWPVITSTATTLAAFGPLMFWPGVMGSFMKYLPITLTITLSCSLFVAMVISPTVCSVVSGGVKKKPDNKHHPFVAGYRLILSAALRHRRLTLALAAIMLLGMFVVYGIFNHGILFFPEMDPNRCIINIRCPQGTNIRETNRITSIVEGRIEPDRDKYELKYIVANVGSAGGGQVLFGSTGGAHVSNLTLIFHDYDRRKGSSAEAIKQIRKAVSDIPGAEIKVEKEEGGPPVGEPVTIRIIGENFKKLEKIADRIKHIIEDVPGLVNLRSDQEGAKPELPMIVDRRRASMLGVNTRVVGLFLKTTIFGREVGKYRQFNDEYDITVRLPQSQRSDIEDIFRLRVPNSLGTPIPLSSLGDFTYAGGFGTISRIDQKRVVTITAGAEGRLNADVLADVREKLKNFELDEEYEIRYVGESKDQLEAQEFLSKAFVVAMLLIVMILVAQFNTLSVPLIIMVTVLLSMFGVLGGLLICKMPFSTIMTGIGVISLAGIVVNNAIVLLDCTRQLQRSGMDAVQAAVKAGATRLRPVLLTATTTILGLVPMATGVSFDFHQMTLCTKSESSQWWASMAIAIIFGLACATILTLVVVPTLYVSLYRLAAKMGLGGLKKPQDISAG